ncbi:PH domain-containing protein [Rhodoblastus acidophilus]|uniref:PH domain-containing protein n=1 Tax=Rhodoblastus acidophilus TaxID=1074 RepID=A0A6N8DIA2_RHOAC|nr:photosynthetic complex putative assembly protein PuhB [Rhodoblastus acidophilus]MCW2273068.1 hypothetical protein [Rhodoblastus acidophilus]MTV29968.1 PH domain-containing protein [Rhodoblastus acidophilus]
MKLVNLEKLLPSDIPPGERVLWFGRPETKSLWRRAYRADWVVIWFALATAWTTFSALGEGTYAAVAAALGTLGLGAAALAILGLLAWLAARTTLYVITERRLVIKSGIALQIFINLPFSQITAANVRAFGDDTGDVTITLAPGQHVSYIALWPSARPWRFVDPEPTLRSVPQAREVAETLGTALQAFVQEQAQSEGEAAQADLAGPELPATA